MEMTGSRADGSGVYTTHGTLHGPGDTRGVLRIRLTDLVAGGANNLAHTSIPFSLEVGGGENAFDSWVDGVSYSD